MWPIQILYSVNLLKGTVSVYSSETLLEKITMPDLNGTHESLV